MPCGPWLSRRGERRCFKVRISWARRRRTGRRWKCARGVLTRSAGRSRPHRRAANAANAGVVLYNIGTVQERMGDRLTGDSQRAKYREASETYAHALDTLRRGGSFEYATTVERRVSPFMNRVAATE